jgi:hypothetical protein
MTAILAPVGTSRVAWRLPIAALEGEKLHKIDGVQLLAVPWRSARHAGRLVLGRGSQAPRLVTAKVTSMPDIPAWKPTPAQ